MLAWFRVPAARPRRAIRPARTAALSLILIASAAAAAGCSSDDEAVPDAGVAPVDASADGAPDGEDLCPGKLSFEAFVNDLVTGDATFDVTVTEDATPENTTSSAPNGRADLCLPTGTDSLVRAELDGDIPRLDLISADAFEIYHGADQPYPLQMVSEADLDTVLTGLGVTRDDAAAQVVVTVLEYPGATPLTGATVELGKGAEQAGARDSGGQFAVADSPAAVENGGLVLFANTQLTGSGQPDQTTVTVTPPGTFSGTCVGPATAPLEAGHITGVLFACH